MKKSYKNLGLILLGLLIIAPLIFPIFNSIDQTPLVSSNNLNLKLPSSLSLNTENELKENILKSSYEILHKGPNTIGFSTKIDSNLEKYIESSNNRSQDIKILIKFNPNLKASQRGELLHLYITNFKVIYNYQIIPAMFISLSIDYLKELCYKVNNIPEIVSIKLNTAIQLQDVIPNTQNFDSNFTTSYTENNWWLDAIGADNTTLTGKGVKIAIMDTGITVHPDFFENGNPTDSRIVLSKNFTSQNDVSISNYVYDAYGHGTHCAGIAGGNGYLSDGKYRGVAPEVSLVNAKISNSTGGIEEADVIAAVDWCVQNDINIISMSFGGQYPVVWDLESEAIESAVNNGVVILSSAGNSGPELGTAGSPGSVMYSISVGATDNNNHVTSFSSLGPSFQNQLLPDICAPGRYIIAPESKASLLSVELGYQDNVIQGTKDKYFGYLSLSGTSMACPMAAGAVALLLEAYPNASPETIRNALIIGAIPMERKASEGYGFGQGAGLINVPNSLKYLREIVNETGDVNSQVKSFARQVPYAPFDLLKFPGDSQSMNLTLYAGESKEISIEYPELDGIDFITNISSLKFLQHDLNSLPFIVKIAYNASYGHKIGYIQIKDQNTDQILDKILVNITVAAPRGKILFESYHGLNDLMPFDAPLYSNMELYHYFHDLYQLNYSVKFFQQNLTVDYSSSTDAQILNPELLSGIDLLVLSPPQLMYSTYEIQVIKDFYENGGNIMFLGTLRNKFLDNSINHLFNELNSNIRIGNQDIFDFTDYARYATYSPKLITEFNNSSPIFQDIDHIFYPFGCSFQNSSGINVLAAYNNLPVVVMDENKVSHGKIIAFGDYHFLKDSFYDNLNDYDQNFHFMKNLMNTLIKHSNSDLYSILCDIDQENQTLNQNDLNFGIRVLNLNNSEPISSLIPANMINASLILPNLTQTPISLTYNSLSQLYQGVIQENFQNISGVYSIDCQVEIDGQNYNRTFNFLTNNFGTVSYSNITFSPEESQELDRTPDETYIYSVNSSLSGVDSINSSIYFSIVSKSFLSHSFPTQISSKVLLNGSSSSFSVQSNSFNNSGDSWIYCIDENHLNDYRAIPIDISPDRFYFEVKNLKPTFNLDSSTIGGLAFASTQSENGVFPVNIIMENSISIKVSVDNIQPYEDALGKLNVNLALFPIFTYTGYINFLNPIEIPHYSLKLNQVSLKFEGNFEFPTSLNYTQNGNQVSKSLETDWKQFYSLLWISIRDNEGETSDLYLLIAFSNKPQNLMNFYPVLGLIGLIIVSVLLLNYKDKIYKKYKEISSHTRL